MTEPPTLPTLTHARVLALAAPETAARGEAYYRDGAVIRTARRGHVLHAEVEGSQFEPYVVRARLDAGGVADARCSCPYEWGGICKHLVAMLLAYADAPESFALEPTAEELVAGIAPEALREIVLGAAAEVPGFENWLAARAAVLRARPPAAGAAWVGGTPAGRGRARRTAVDTGPIERSLRHTLREVDPHEWGGGLDAPGALRPTIEQARAFVEHGDGVNALAVLRVVMRLVAPDYEVLEGECELSDYLEYEVTPLLAEAILLAEPDAGERRALTAELKGWRDDLAEYSAEDACRLPLMALARGLEESGDGDEAYGEDDEAYDYDDEDEVDEDDDYDDEDGEDGEDDLDGPGAGGWGGSARPWRLTLADVRLNALEHSGQVDRFLEQAAAHGRRERLCLKLIELERVDEAVEAGRAVERASEALAVAAALRDAGQLEAAIALAERGLELGSGAGEVGRWLGPVAAQLGRDALARSAWLVAYRERPDVEGFQALETLSEPAEWPALRADLLDRAEERSSFPQEGTAILLHAGEADRAIRLADASGHYAVLAQVADVVLADRPEWVIRVGCREAEGLIARTQSQYYAIAAVWLGRVKRAHAAAGTLDDWEAYLAALRATHRRKRALLPLLDRL